MPDSVQGALSNGSEFVIRPYKPEDRNAILALRAKHGEGYWFADPSDPVHFMCYVIEVGGEIRAVITGRATVEAFFMLDKSFGLPGDRLELTRALVEFGAERAYEHGIREIHIGVGANERGWLRRVLGFPSTWIDNRFHVIMSVWHRFKGVEHGL